MRDHDLDRLIKLKQLRIETRVLLDQIFRNDDKRVLFLELYGPDLYEFARQLWYRTYDK